MAIQVPPGRTSRRVGEGQVGFVVGLLVRALAELFLASPRRIARGRRGACRRRPTHHSRSHAHAGTANRNSPLRFGWTPCALLAAAGPHRRCRRCCALLRRGAQLRLHTRRRGTRHRPARTPRLSDVVERACATSRMRMAVVYYFTITAAWHVRACEAGARLTQPVLVQLVHFCECCHGPTLFIRGVRLEHVHGEFPAALLGWLVIKIRASFHAKVEAVLCWAGVRGGGTGAVGAAGFLDPTH